MTSVWGLVFIGLLVAVIILQRAESDLITESYRDTLIISYEIEEVAEEFSESPVLEKASGRIRAKIIEHIEEFGFHAARLYEDELSISIGEIEDGDDVYEYILHYLIGSHLLVLPTLAYSFLCYYYHYQSNWSLLY